jgi:small ligand-binding sensory domain FIST
MAGFFGNGEFAPVGGRNWMHNYTGVLVVGG